MIASLLCPECRRIRPSTPSGKMSHHVAPTGGKKCPGVGRKGFQTPGRAACVHCGQTRQVRRRGLCWGCFENREIREQFDSFCRRGIGIDGDSRLPEPTDALTIEEGGHYATEAKLAILSMRAERGESLHHPDDARRCLA
jgi:hypothetical protein